MAGKFKHERYCDAAKFFFCAISAYPSAMRTEALGSGLSRSHSHKIKNLGVNRC